MIDWAPLRFHADESIVTTIIDWAILRFHLPLQACLDIESTQTWAATNSFTFYKKILHK